MGLTKKQQGNYLKITKEGKFVLGKDNENTYDEFTGTLTNLSFKNDEYEGQPIRKLVLTFEDEGETYFLSFAFDSSYSSSFVSFLKNADLNKRMTLIPVLKEEGEKVTRSLLIKQGDTFLKSYYTKDNNHGQPSMKKVVKKSGKVEWDKEDFLEFRENVINNEILPLLKNGNSHLQKRTSEPLVEDFLEESTEEKDDLPF